MLTLTSNEILELFGIKSPGTLTKWRALGAGQAVIGRNRWAARVFLEWWLSNIYDGVCSETDGSLAEARRDYWAAKAEREKIALSREKGAMVAWSEVEAGWSERVRVVASGLEAWSDRLPALLVGRSREEIHGVIKAEVRELRQRFSMKGRYCPECDG